MRKARFVTAVAGAVLVIATTGGAALAGSAPTYETRGQFIFQLDVQLGIKPVSPGTPAFSDVPPSSPFYGYIEAAYQAGITNGFKGGTFGPDKFLTRAEAAKYEVVASGYDAAAQGISTTHFSDNGQIPSALVGYVGEAATLNLLSGFLDGSFGPNQYLTTGQETHLLAQLKTVTATTAATKLAIKASTDDAAAGQFVTLSAVAENSAGNPVSAPIVTYRVTSNNAQQTILSGTSFVASTPGTYTVEGVAGAATGTVTIHVFGTPAALKVSSPNALVADGAAQATVTVSVVDASGNVVANNSDNITLRSSDTGALSLVVQSGVTGAAETSRATNGVATFTVQGGSTPGSVAGLTATDASDTSLTGTATITTTGQTATGVALKPTSDFLTANGTATTVIDAQVVDQGGQPMLYGTYGFTVSLSGPAQFVDGSTTAHSFVYGGNGSSNAVTPVTIEDVQGETGTITVTATAGGLQSGQATLTAVISGAAKSIGLTPPSTTSFSEDNGGIGLRYGIQAVDSHGYPVTDNIPLVITVKNSSGSIATNINVDGLSQSTTAGATDNVALANGFFTVTDKAKAADAGTYTITMTDPSGALTAPSPVTFTETAGAVSMVTLSGPGFVPAAQPSATLTAQITDSYGNPIAAQGTTVAFSSTASGISPSSTTATVSSAGSATATFTVPAYVGQTFPVTATATLNGQPYSTKPFNITVVSVVAQHIAVSIVDAVSSGAYFNNGAVAQSGDPVTITIKATDQSGNTVPTPDTVLVSMSGGGTLLYPNTSSIAGGGVGAVKDNGDGTWTVTMFGGLAVFDAHAQASGTLVLTAKDESVSPQIFGAANYGIAAGPVEGFELLDASGNVASGETVTANQPLQLTLQPVDLVGNPAVPAQNYIVGLKGPAAGAFRLSASGADTPSISVIAGTAGTPVYYVSGGPQTNADLQASAWVAYPANSTLSLGNGSSLTFTTSGGILSDVTSPAHLAGMTFTAPAAGSGSDTIDYTVNGTVAFSFQLTW